MDALKREIINDYTWNDLNCRRYVRHTKGRNQYEKEMKRKARRKRKQEDYLTMTKIQMTEEQSRLYNEIQEKKREIFNNISKERLMEIAHKMHTYIFIHTGDEQEVYDELGLTDEENLLFGYGGQIRLEFNDDKDN